MKTVLLSAMLMMPMVTHAMDTELRLGPSELVAGFELLNEYIDQGSLRHGDVPGRGYFRARYQNIGFEFDTVIALSEDDRTKVSSMEIVESGFRIDYLFYLPETAQIMPFFEADSYPNWDKPDDAYWLGVDGWYLMPFEGLEVGGSIALDTADDAGWRGSIGARQLFQEPPFDLQSYQLINFGNDEYHEYLGGSESGFTTFEIGVLATLPLPYEQLWATFRIGGHFWLQDGAAEDDVEIEIGFGIQYHLASFGAR